MVDIVMPTSLCPSNSSWGIQSNTAQFQSKFTGAIWTAGSRYSLWICTLSFDNLSGDARAELQAWILALNGQENRAVFNDHAFRLRGTGGGTPLVNGAGQTGSVVNFDGAANAVGYLKAGDQFYMGGQLKMATADVTTAGGAGTVGFNPPIRGTLDDNSPITIAAQIKSRFILQGNEHEWSNAPGPQTPFSNFSLSFVEDIL